MPDVILVTGALGNVGAEVVKSLQAGGHAARAAYLDVAKLREPHGDAAGAVTLDFSRPETFAPALADVKRLFLMRPPQITDVKRYLFPFLDAAQAAGVEQVAFLSLIGVEQNQRVPHYKVEQYLRASTLRWTFLRASFFMQNLSGTHRAEIRERGELYVPVGRGKTSFIDVRDIGAVAAAALTQAGHDNTAYDLTGPAPLDYYEVAAILSEVLGRPIVYRNPSVPAFLWRTVRGGTALPFALVMAYLYTQTRRGMSAFVTGEVGRLLGRPPITLSQFATDYRQVWQQ
jgi:uncharacterized protein YbjT (DUF2867 family)